MRFFDTLYFGGFCQPSKDFNQVCTMHANCCVGLDNKVNDLKFCCKYGEIACHRLATPMVHYMLYGPSHKIAGIYLSIVCKSYFISFLSIRFFVLFFT